MPAERDRDARLYQQILEEFRRAVAAISEIRSDIIRLKDDLTPVLAIVRGTSVNPSLLTTVALLQAEQSKLNRDIDQARTIMSRLEHKLESSARLLDDGDRKSKSEQYKLYGSIVTSAIALAGTIITAIIVGMEAHK